MEAEADCPITMSGIDLIECTGDTFTTCEFCRRQWHEKIAAPLLQQTHIAQMHAEADNRARSCGTPEAHRAR